MRPSFHTRASLLQVPQTKVAAYPLCPYHIVVLDLL